MKNIFEKFRLVAGTLATVTLVAFSLQYSFSGYAYKNAENLHEEVWAQNPCWFLESEYYRLVSQFNSCMGWIPTCNDWPDPNCRSLCFSVNSAYLAWQNCLNGNHGGGDPGGGNSSTGTGTGGGSSSGGGRLYTEEHQSCTVECCSKTPISSCGDNDWTDHRPGFKIACMPSTQGLVSCYDDKCRHNGFECGGTGCRCAN